MERQACAYPGCSRKDNLTISLPMLEVTKDKVVRQKRGAEGIAIGISCCVHHMLILGSGQFGIIEENGKQMLHGPFGEVSLMEAVATAVLMDHEAQKQKEAKR